MHGDPVPPLLTVQAIAREEGDISPVEILRQIKQARIELFGRDLSDRAIRYRLARDGDHGLPDQRPCAEPGCPRPLPARATKRRRYCAFHAAPHARTSRSRARRANG